MVSVTLSVPEETRDLMRRHDEVNWSGFIRKTIEAKAKDMEKIEELRQQLKKEKPITDWAVKLQHASRLGRLAELKKKGLI